MESINVGDRYTASHSGCRKFPLPVQVTCLNPVFPRVTVQDEIGTRIVGLHAMESCIAHGCIRKIHAKKPVTILQHENSACSLAAPVLYCSTVGGGQFSQPPTSGPKTATQETSVFMANVIATFVRTHSGRLSQFEVPGVGKVYVTVGSFPDKVVPTELDVTAFGLREPTEGKPVKAGDEEKAAAAAAKAQEKAEKAAAKAAAAQEKAAARVAKAQAAAAAAVARAEKAAAGAASAAGSQPEL
jgi:hypothetical protein